MATYSDVTDLLTGNVPTPTFLDPEKYVQDAADEIDSALGFVYTTPIVGASRPTELLLKRINNHLATGRLILAAAAGNQDVRLNAYGLSLVNEALASLTQIREGAIQLDAPKTDDGSATGNGPLIYNEDETSRVSDFYADHPTYISPKEFAPSRFYVW